MQLYNGSSWTTCAVMLRHRSSNNNTTAVIFHCRFNSLQWWKCHFRWRRDNYSKGCMLEYIFRPTIANSKTTDGADRVPLPVQLQDYLLEQHIMSGRMQLTVPEHPMVVKLVLLLLMFQPLPQQLQCFCYRYFSIKWRKYYQ